MATRNLYKCECGNNFEATVGNIMHSFELRCENCDHQAYIKNGGSEKSICEKCNGLMKKNLEPMCPLCKTRNSKIEKNLLFID